VRPRLLDLFCGAGGAAMGYHRAGFDVVGVDIVPQPNYPFDFVEMDALELMRIGMRVRHVFQFNGRYMNLSDFDAIHASPPCQGYHSLGEGLQLIGETRKLLDESGLPYVIENIPEAGWAMSDPVLICGTMFDPILGVKRHRLFETNWQLEPPMWGCRHKLASPRFRVYEHGHWYLAPFAKVYGSGGGKAREHWPEAMGIDWMTDAELVQAIPPVYTEHIGHQLIQQAGAEAPRPLSPHMEKDRSTA
jgi:DNA (cytosine-5)-methyltransferase 1